MLPVNSDGAPVSGTEKLSAVRHLRPRSGMGVDMAVRMAIKMARGGDGDGGHQLVAEAVRSRALNDPSRIRTTHEGSAHKAWEVGIHSYDREGLRQGGMHTQAEAGDKHPQADEAGGHAHPGRSGGHAPLAVGHAYTCTAMPGSSQRGSW